MKKTLMFFCTLMLSTMVAFAQADKIVGTYKMNRNGVNSKVKIYKKNGGYQAQVIWVDNLKMPDGSTRLDEKNPDPAKRSTPANQIIIVEKVTYSDGEWKDGRIYDPTKGKTYKAVIDFKDDKTLRVKGYLGPFHESMYWTKIE